MLLNNPSNSDGQLNLFFIVWNTLKNKFNSFWHVLLDKDIDKIWETANMRAQCKLFFLHEMCIIKHCILSKFCEQETLQLGRVPAS